MEYIVETTNLCKQYPGKLACDSINMKIRKGDIYGFIGKNGAGKTTLMKILLGLTNATSGSFKLFESDNLDEQRKKIGSLIEAPGLYKDCSAYENMKRFSMIYGGTKEEINELLKIVGLDNVGKRKAGQFSLGMRQRLGIAISMLGNPELLILDEPINGLDPAGIKEIRDTLLKINKERGVTMLVSSHLLDELAKITTRYGIINNGVLVEEIDAAELEERCKTSLVITSDNAKRVVELLMANNIIDSESYTINENSVVITKGFDKPAEINELLVKSGLKVSELKVSGEGFENYFIERIGK